MKGSSQKMLGPPKNSNHARHEDLEPKTLNHGKHGDSRKEDRVASEERTGPGPTRSGETPGLTHHNSEAGLCGKFRIPNKLKLLPYSLAAFRWCCDQYSALLFTHNHMNILYFP